MVSTENRQHLTKTTKGSDYLWRVGKVKGNTKGLATGKVVVPRPEGTRGGSCYWEPMRGTEKATQVVTLK